MIAKYDIWLSLILFSYGLQAQEYSNQQLGIFNELTKGVSSIGVDDWRFSAIDFSEPNIVPLFWGDHRAYTGDIYLPQYSYPSVAIAGEYKKGRFIALGHAGLLMNSGANDNFTQNILNWLGNGYGHKKIIIYGSFKKESLSTDTQELLKSEEVEIAQKTSQITIADLTACDLLIFVNPAKILVENEIESIATYVSQGGSLLLVGEGWLWEMNRQDIKNFPLNKLGERLGFKFSRTSIDKAPPDNKIGPRRYSIVDFQTLSKRKPVRVKVFSIAEHNNEFIKNSVALNKDKYHYALEGEHIILSMPYRFFCKCKKPVEFIKQLDAVYEKYLHLTNGIKPFDGHKIIILNISNMYFNMSSGNPILSRDNRIEYILEELEKSNYQNPSWGLMHELGHDFIICMKHYFVFGGGDNESWAEFFASYACQELRIKGKEPIWKENARAYHESGAKDFQRIKNEKWLMIGFLDHIREEYGWDVYRKLFKRYSELIRENNYPGFNETEKKVNIFVKELSLAAGVNFYPFFAKWGFPVDRSVYDELKHLPRAKLNIAQKKSAY